MMYMNSKTLILVIATLVCILGLVFVLRMKGDKPSASVSTDQNPPSQTTSGGALSPEMISVDEKTSQATIAGSYPQFSQASKEFNQKIKDLIEGEIESFKSNDFMVSESSLDITTNIIQSNNQFISAILHFDSDTGGAHPITSIATFNYDVKNKKELSLTDFITLQEASGEVRAKLAEKFKADGNLDANAQSMLNAGTDPKILENWQNFTFTDREITIYFSEYQVAPYAYGEQTVTILRK